MELEKCRTLQKHKASLKTSVWPGTRGGNSWTADAAQQGGRSWLALEKRKSRPTNGKSYLREVCGSYSHLVMNELLSLSVLESLS